MIDFNEKTYARILASQLNRVPDTIDKREGSIIQTALGPESWYLEGVYLDLDRLQNNVYAGTAGGDSLDKIAVQYGLERKAAVRAVKKGIFDIMVPIGSRFSAMSENTYMIYRVTGYIEVSETKYVFSMECETAGSQGNDYSGKILPIESVNGLTYAELKEVITPGADEEDDESLRSRILMKVRKPSTSGNKYDYYNWAMECEGVGASKIFPLAAGPGTVKVVIADEKMKAAGPALVKTVADHIEELRPVGADVTVVSAKEQTINVSARIRIKNGANLGNIQNAFQEELKNYLKQNAFDLTYVSMARVGTILLGTAGVDDYDGLLLNGVSANAELGQEEIAVAGTVALEVMI
ncbi:baseplate J/gp47 family protein [Clostridium sp. AM58-1XD]|uniref:baseplate J/gp47 family protein n=1 Tax=Clostridium sp. AM58-1XD TaxID=2292307 RepID=UPI000E46D7E9|nr:baseplate J/gp47 family protein [Clostridium sp. AM58-1XD]RGY97275.1 hypothetical protein DXA13_15150 [Clostridium sp. AM58-1XD]